MVVRICHFGIQHWKPWNIQSFSEQYKRGLILFLQVFGNPQTFSSPPALLWALYVTALSPAALYYLQERHCTLPCSALSLLQATALAPPVPHLHGKPLYFLLKYRIYIASLCDLSCSTLSQLQANVHSRAVAYLHTLHGTVLSIVPS